MYSPPLRLIGGAPRPDASLGDGHIFYAIRCTGLAVVSCGAMGSLGIAIFSFGC